MGHIISHKSSLACLADAFDTEKSGKEKERDDEDKEKERGDKGKEKEQPDIGCDVVDLTCDNDDQVVQENDDRGDHNSVKKLLISMLSLLYSFMPSM